MKALLLLATCLLCLPLSAADAQNTGPAGSKGRPNVLFILVDDQSPFDFRFYNPQSTLQTPNIDRLAEQGMVFDSAVHMGAFMGAVCTPSRHMIMSGRTVWHLPISPGVNRAAPAPGEDGPKGKKAKQATKAQAAKALGDRSNLCPPHIEEQTIGAVFKRAGYRTMRTCKQGNCYPQANKQFEIVHDASKRGGDAESGSAWHAEQVLNFLNDREASADKAPFFIYFGFSHPHDTRDGTPELLAKYGAVNHADPNSLPALNPLQPPLPPNYLPKHPFDNTALNIRDEVAVSGVWKNRDQATIRNELGREYACSENIDIQIGRVLERLQAMGELDNTYIIYTADHGIAIGRHGLQGKQNLYEHTWRVPFIAKGPGIPAGKRVAGNAYLLDLLATFCDLTGVPAPETNEGLSLKPVLTGKTDRIRDTLYGVYCGNDKPGMRCVRKGDWKLIQYETADGKVKETQLFNLAENPHEFLAEHQHPQVHSLTAMPPGAKQVNLADDPAHAAKLAEMKALLLAEMQRLNDPWRFSDQPAAKAAR